MKQLFLSAGVLLLPLSLEQAKPVFGANADAVRVHVSVWKGDNPVDRLNAADFTLTDNGVPQMIEAFSLETVPIDLSLVVDVSGSTRGASSRFQQNIRKMLALLGPDDRARLIVFGARVTEVFPMQPVTPELTIDRLVPGGPTIVLLQALEYALAWRPDVGRQHLVTLFSDGFSAGPSSRFEFLKLVTARSPAVLHVGLSRAYGGPKLTPHYDALRAAALESGGEVHDASDAYESFRRMLLRFRRGYVLSYAPDGVNRVGWHEINVTLTRKENWIVRARRGYHID
jgi:hypothetical protein